MQLLSRVMAAHKLTVLSFYTYILKYLTYHQLRVPAILVALAQSVHDLTPPDVLTPVIQKLAHEFIHPGVGSEVIAAGLNSIREVCRRQPWAMEEDLLGDLVEYRKSREKSVTAAARGLLQLYREVNPGMLKRRERVRHLFLVQHAAVIHIHISGKSSKHGNRGRQPTITIWSQCASSCGYRRPCGKYHEYLLSHIMIDPLISSSRTISKNCGPKLAFNLAKMMAMKMLGMVGTWNRIHLNNQTILMAGSQWPATEMTT